jgi:D-3-phosphoglycerate dehydrogenase / 2-oxoglutarate reductase
MTKKVFISTTPFGEFDDTPIRLLSTAGAIVTFNSLERRMTEGELALHLKDAYALIAGTEPVTHQVMDANPNLRLISRVGIGLDNVDLLAARDRQIEISYTPDAPSPAVAELTIGHIITLLRRTHYADRKMHKRQWKRFHGRRIAQSTIGVIGYGRIGQRVVQLLSSFKGCRVLVNDLDQSAALPVHAIYTNLETLCQKADVVTVHAPLTPQNVNMIDSDIISLMKPDAFLVNTARGGIVHEEALAKALRTNQIAGAAIDVFTQEPYTGPLCDINSCILSCHMGSMSIDCRIQMEIEATKEVIRMMAGKPRISSVPENEYLMR